MKKEEILKQVAYKSQFITYDDIIKNAKEEIDEAMETYAKQEAFLFSEFKNDYQRIEGMNVRHDQIENFGGQMYSWISASNDVIWEAYKKGEQLKRYFENKVAV
jgi:hypothetical protein